MKWDEDQCGKKQQRQINLHIAKKKYNKYKIR